MLSGLAGMLNEMAEEMESLSKLINNAIRNKVEVEAWIYEFQIKA